MNEDEIKKARLRALAILTDRDKTEKELLDKLKKEGFDPEAALDALEYVKGYGYIDDERYARAFASYRMEKKSRRQLEYELLKRGIDKEVIREELSSLYEDVDESALIAAYLEKKLGGTLPGCLPDRSDEKAWAKLYRHLTGRGYTMENIKRAISHFT